MENEENKTVEQNTEKVTQKKDGTVGPAIATLIIVILLIMGAFYFYGYIRDNIETQKEATQQNVAEQVNETQNIPNADEILDQSDSDEEEAIEEDLEALNIDEFDKEMKDIDREFDNI